MEAIITMQLVQYLSTDSISPEITAGSKQEILELLVEKLCSFTPSAKKDPILKLLQERESLSTTGIGGGLAIPHCKTNLVDDLVIVFAKSSEGIEFQSLDQKPVHLFFLLVAPEDSSSIHLKALAKIARFSKNEEMREKIMTLETAEDILLFIQEQETNFD